MDAEREREQKKREAAIAFRVVAGRPLSLEEFDHWFAIVADFIWFDELKKRKQLGQREKRRQRDERDELGVAFGEWRDRVEQQLSGTAWWYGSKPLIFSSYGNLVSRLRKLLKRISKLRHGPEWEILRRDVEEAVKPSTRLSLRSANMSRFDGGPRVRPRPDRTLATMQRFETDYQDAARICGAAFAIWRDRPRLSIQVDHDASIQTAPDVWLRQPPPLPQPWSVRCDFCVQHALTGVHAYACPWNNSREARTHITMKADQLGGNWIEPLVELDGSIQSELHSINAFVRHSLPEAKSLDLCEQALAHVEERLKAEHAALEALGQPQIRSIFPKGSPERAEKIRQSRLKAKGGIWPFYPPWLYGKTVSITDAKAWEIHGREVELGETWDLFESVKAWLRHIKLNQPNSQYFQIDEDTRDTRRLG